MKNLLLLFALCATALSLVGCAVAYRAPVIPPQGMFFTSVKAPITTDFHKTPVNQGQGKAQTAYLNIPIFGLPPIAWGEADIRAAMQAGNLTAVDYADYEFTNILGIYATFTTIAYGPRRD